MKDDKEFKSIEDEIINSIMRKLKAVYGLSGRPSKNIMKEIVTQLSYIYPVMFREIDGEGLYIIC